MIVLFRKQKNALSKLRQQFIKCKLFGYKHPVFSYAHYAISEVNLQELFCIKKYSVFTTEKKGCA